MDALLDADYAIQHMALVISEVSSAIFSVLQFVDAIYIDSNVSFNPLNANDANRHHVIRKWVSANDAYRRRKLACAIPVEFLRIDVRDFVRYQ